MPKIEAPESVKIQSRQNWALLELKKHEAALANLAVELCCAQAKEFDIQVEARVEQMNKPKIGLPGVPRPGSFNN